MKFSILLSILFDLLSKRKVTATELAQKHGVSTRTVYRYIDLLSTSAPVCVERGRNGGIFIHEEFKLPVDFFTEEEFSAIVEALETAYENQPQERFLKAKRKLTSKRALAH